MAEKVIKYYKEEYLPKILKVQPAKMETNNKLPQKGCVVFVLSLFLFLSVSGLYQRD